MLALGSWRIAGLLAKPGAEMPRSHAAVVVTWSARVSKA
ncbi:hypothetical protein X758_16820 [Mesorhizobium sp. LSHC416B00]|nr:hypothetical protein X761_14095 [Mesorhizobium sp. LSHC424B00]ESX70512.1 hypothetical protein X758_16820 [Mesorhizobium sp. LSHC416B00]